MTDEPTQRRGRRRHRSLSVRARLLALVLVPLLGLAATGAGTMVARRDTARSAAEIHRSVDRISRLVALRLALHEERAYTGTVRTVVHTMTMSLAQVSAIAGYDIEAELGHWKGTTDEARGDLGEDDAVLTADDLAALRANPGDTTPTALTAAFDPVERRLDAAKDRILADLRPLLTMAGAVPVADGLTAVRTELDLVEALGDRLTVRNQLFMGVGDPAPLMRRMAAAGVTEARGLADIRGLGVAPIAEAAAAFDADPVSRRYREASDAIAAGDYPTFARGPADWERLRVYTNDGLAHTTGLFALIQRSTAAVAAIAADLQADAERDLRLGAVGESVLGLGALAVSVLLARSITRPLRELRDRAAELSAGHVDIEPVPEDGPAEFAVTTRAINDLVANLRLLQDKTRALADLDFDATALAEPLPGPLGQALQRSVQALSGSIHERDELRRHILHQASHDEVTGLHNRGAAIEEVGDALTRAHRLGRGVAVLLVDVDGFKRLNDTHGNAQGDALLRSVARRLERAAGRASLVARAGGDEFLVLVEDVEDADEVTALARRLALAVGGDVIAATGSALTACVGVAFSWTGAAQPDELLAGADLAVTGAKRHGPGSVEIHDPALQRQLVAQAALEEALTAALGRDDELFLQYQPVIDPTTGRMSSVEALVRWNRPGLGVQPPDSFIPVAERSNLIIDLDRWVLARAIGQLAEWGGHPLLRSVDVAVNVSGRHLASGTLPDHVTGLLRAQGVDPRRLIIELTETVLLDDLAIASEQLQGLRALGVRVALDDFGTGYTSVAQLRELPVDIVKIDRSFVQRLDSVTDQALLRLIIEVGHTFGTSITAEGVETSEQYDLLRTLGCDRAQGFLMSRPLTTDDLVRWTVEHDGDGWSGTVTATADLATSTSPAASPPTGQRQKAAPRRSSPATS